jgi:hypothetical protein
LELFTQVNNINECIIVFAKPKVDKSDDMIERLLPELSNIYQIYEKGNIIQKHTLIRGVFKDNLLWGGGMFRTAFIDPVFYDNVMKVKKKGLLFYEQPSQIFDRNPVSTQSRGRTGTALRPQVFETSASTDSAIWASFI